MRLAVYLIFAICICCAEGDLDYTVELERTEPIRGHNENLFDFSQVRVRRRGEQYTFNGNFTFLVDLDNSFMVEVLTSYSPKGDGKFVRQPFRIDKTPGCTFFNLTYANYIKPVIESHSNFPVIPPEGLCPIPKDVYMVEDAPMDESNFPSHMIPGLWKIENKYYKQLLCVGGVILYLKLENKA